MAINLQFIVIWKSDYRFPWLKRAHDTKVVHAMLNVACGFYTARTASLQGGQSK